MTSSPTRYTVDAGAEGERLDRFLAVRVGSRAQAQRRIEAGAVRVGGRPAKPSHRVRAGEVVEVDEVEPEPAEARPEAIPLTILYQDDHLVVLDKPAGLVVHPAAGHRSGTLVNALLHAVGPLSGVGGVLRPGIVHRLDRGTTGVMVATRSDAAHRGLAEQFRRHTIERRYLAIVAGEPAAAAGEIRTLHGRHPTDRKRFTGRMGRGKPAITRWRVVERLGGAALIECALLTGRTHQVRVHMAEHGHGLLGDPTYGRPPRDPRLREVAGHLGRPALHAAHLGFVHPVTGAPMAFQAPLPADLAAALAALRRPAR